MKIEPHIDRMNHAARTLPTRVLVVVAAAALGAGTLGCGVLSKAKQAVDNVSAISSLADKLGKSDKLTYTAEYKLDDGSTATVAQEPPKAAFIGKAGRFVLTEEALLLCTTSSGKTACQRSPNQSKAAASADQAAYLTAVAGGGFISAPMAVALMGAAALVPGAKIDKSDKKVAGVQSTCLHVTGIPADKDPTAVTAKEFTVCVGDNGVLTTFAGVGTDGKKVGVELTKFGDKVDEKSFAAPGGAKVVDVQTLTPPN
jgi:hypothetical protein